MKIFKKNQPISEKIYSKIDRAIVTCIEDSLCEKIKTEIAEKNRTASISFHAMTLDGSFESALNVKDEVIKHFKKSGYKRIEGRVTLITSDFSYNNSIYEFFFEVSW